MKIEICSNSFESAKNAQEAGADRIELCTELSVGGLTPSHGLIEKVCSELSIPVHVLIRPRSGDFCYSAEEIDIMIRDILFSKKIGCQGVVSGILTPENNIDSNASRRLINASEGLEFTFHRAFDWCENPLQEVENLFKIGVNRVLSSGQQNTAIEGIDLLKQMLKVSEDKIEIMPGSGINSSNALAFKEAGFSSIHFSATEKNQVLKNSPKVSMHSNSFFEEGIIATSKKELILQIKSILS